MLKPYFSNPMALYAEGFQSFETASFYDLGEKINYKSNLEILEQGHLVQMILDLEKHIYNLRNFSEANKATIKHIQNFVRYINAEKGCLGELINSFNDFSPEVNIFRFEFEKLLNEKDEKNKKILFTECRISILLENVKNKINEENFAKEKNKLRTRIEKNRKSLFEYTDFLQKKYSSLEIVRFEIAFPCCNENERNKFIEKYIKYKKDFLYFLIKRQFKHSIVGHLWKFQPQQEDGYVSCHVVLFLNTADLKKDLKHHHTNDKMKIIQSRWSELTNDRGGFWSSNSRFEYRCTHAISFRNNNIETELKKIVDYFINPDYFIRLNLTKGTRSYGRGEIPRT